MMKLLIADDEESIRKGLKCIVDWEDLGFTVCGEASNGNEALQAIKDYSPDVVLLDIKMPGLTGIEVMENVNQYYNSRSELMPSFLILSGFSQFEYAQKAINLGAKGYLLKPVDEDELKEKILSIKKQIEEKKSGVEDSLTVKKLESKEFFRNLLLTEKFDQDSNDEYTILYISPDYFPAEDKSLIEKCIDNYFSFFSIEKINIKENLIVILKNANEEAVSNCIDRFVKHYPERCFIIRGKKEPGFQGCINSYKEVLSYMNYLFFVSNIPFVCEKEIKWTHFETSFETFEKSLNDFYTKAVFCIETYDKGGMVELQKTIKDSLFIVNAKPSEIKQKTISCLMEIYNRVQLKYPERELEDLQSLDIVSRVLELHSFNDVFVYFNNVLNNLLENFNTNTADSVIVKVIAYVKSNYSNDLKLEILGDLFNCNSAYLGKKFKKYTGVQFNTYLDNLRIEEAKNKLLNTDLKIYQISKIVGYANTDYFFMKFKKATGMTPKEFKDINGNHSE